jgi:hypothetical protein
MVGERGAFPPTRKTHLEGSVNQRGSYSQAEVVFIGFGHVLKSQLFINKFQDVLVV